MRTCHMKMAGLATLDTVLHYCCWAGRKESVDDIEAVSAEVSLRVQDETLLVGTSVRGEDGKIRGGVVVVVDAAQDECTSVAAGLLLGAIYPRLVGRTRIVRSDSSNLGFAVWHRCTGRSTICYGCLVAQYRKGRDNRLQTMSIVTVVG